MPEYKLTYFNCKALGEPIRFLLSYGNLGFEDVRIEDDDWPALKSSMPLGQMPILEFNGIRAFQSVAITRYVAKTVGLGGANLLEDLKIDTIVDTIGDLRAKIADFHYEEDKALQQKKREPVEKETVPFYLGKLEAFVKDNNGHLALGKLTWADVYFAGVLDYLNYMMERDITDGYPGLKKVVETVLKIDSIAKWVAKRPVTDA